MRLSRHHVILTGMRSSRDGGVALKWSRWGRYGWLRLVVPGVILIVLTSILENSTGDGLSGVSEVFGATNSISWLLTIAAIPMWALARHLRPPRKHYQRNPMLLALGAIFTALGIAVIVTACFLPRHTVTAIPTDATVQQSHTANACANGGRLRISLTWKGATVIENDQSQPCTHDYATGDHLTVYVSSASPVDPGADPQWILDPSTHDPFDVIGPNDLPVFIGLFGASLVIGGIAALILSADRREPAPTPASRMT
jgi:hypothetical protein